MIRITDPVDEAVLMPIDIPDEEKMAIYMKCSKKELSELLIESNKILDKQLKKIDWSRDRD